MKKSTPIVCVLWLAGMMSAAAATAQTTPPATAPDTGDPAPAGDIVVTGSRIARPDYEAPNPIVSYGDAAIRQSGNTNVTTFLQRVPALTNSIDSGDSAGPNRPGGQLFGAAGLNLLDLRGLGPARTLVLVNGRRHVAGQIDTAAVDINAIPTDLIERVDVLTGGASAVYGADGVSGVVNFILKRDFDGVAARTQFGVSERGDAGNRFTSVMAGRNFADGRGNVTAYYEYNADDRLRYEDRDYLRGDRRQYVVSNPAYVGPGSGTFQQGLAGDLRYPGGSPAGVIDIGGMLYNGDGSRYDPGTRAGGGFVSGGSATPVAGYVGDLLPQTERHAANLLAHYDVSDAFQLSVEGKFVQSTATTFGGFSGNYTGNFSTLDNPFVPTALRDAALANSQLVLASNRNNTDFPRLGESDRRRTWRGVVAATGRIGDHARYDVSYTYGQTDVRITKLNDRWEDRYYAALDVVTDPATGRATCRSNLNPAAVQVPTVSFTPGAGSGCLPLNTFGVNVYDPAALAWTINDNVSTARVTQSVANAALTGDFGALFALPGGPVRFALGGEYRRETSRFRPNAFLTGEQWYQYDEGDKFDPLFVISPSRGAFDVWEGFGELELPLLKDLPFAETLTVGAAGRYSDYSTIGSTRAYQFNGLWAPVRDISFRGSYSQAVRAPNIGELFTPTGPATNYFVDPCYVENRGSGSSSRAANCTALITGLGGNPATFTADNNPDASVLINGARSGNPNLRQETARTWTAGLVLRPRFVSGLTVAVDWYDIRLRDAISVADANTVASLCVDQPSLDNGFCASIRRAQGSGYINGYTVQPQNVAEYRTAGLDLNVNYAIRTAHVGDIDLRFVGGYLHRLTQIATPGAQLEDQVDQIGRPKFNFVFSPTWTLDRVTISYNLRWVDAMRRFPKQATDNSPDYAPAALLRYDELWQHDVQAQIAVSDAMSFYGGVNNLGNQRPGVDSVDQPISPLGRYFYAGARVRFGR